MKSTITKVSISSVLLGACGVQAQYAPPPPPSPFPGFVNEYLRKEDPYLNQWDIGGNNRIRFEDKSGFGIPGVAGSMDFRDHGADVVNQYFIDRLRFHLGYTDKWFNIYAEGRSSVEWSDERSAYPNNPPVAGTARYD